MMRMSNIRDNFFGSEEWEEIRQRLQYMVDSSSYNTEPSYAANGLKYPGNLMPFVDKHINYLNSHPKLDAGMYLSNLRLMTRIG